MLYWRRIVLFGRKPKTTAGTCCRCRRPVGIDSDYTKYNVMPHDALTGSRNGPLDMFSGVKTAFVTTVLTACGPEQKLVADRAHQKDKGNVAACSHVGGKTITYDMEHSGASMENGQASVLLLFMAAISALVSRA